MIIISGEEVHRIMMDTSCIGPLFPRISGIMQIFGYLYTRNQVFSLEEMERRARCRISINWPLIKSSANIHFIQEVKVFIVFALEGKRFFTESDLCWT